MMTHRILMFRVQLEAYDLKIFALIVAFLLKHVTISITWAYQHSLTA